MSPLNVFYTSDFIEFDKKQYGVYAHLIKFSIHYI